MYRVRLSASMSSSLTYTRSTYGQLEKALYCQQERAEALHRQLHAQRRTTACLLENVVLKNSQALAAASHVTSSHHLKSIEALHRRLVDASPLASSHAAVNADLHAALLSRMPQSRRHCLAATSSLYQTLREQCSLGLQTLKCRCDALKDMLVEAQKTQKRSWPRAFGEDGGEIMSIKQLRMGECIRICFTDGEAVAAIRKVKQRLA